MKVYFISGICILLLLALVVGMWFLGKSEESKVESDGVQYNSRVEGDSFEIFKDNKWQKITIKGVNIGIAKPGTFPGEAAITEDEYYKWFSQIGEMNANSIRVYTLHPPAFYNALKKYNDKHENKIYVFHGVWINEEKLDESMDAFEEDVEQEFQNEMKTIVDVIHGNKIVGEKAGHASGEYKADISEYVIGWMLGIEWYPYTVKNTNNKHASIGEYQGEYFETKGAEPFEHWLAQQMDVLVKYEKENYNWIRPMSFTNWVTTDILEHSSEPDEKEDLASVNPNVIYTTGDMNLTKQFASYHVYPYYPDFFNYDEKYKKYKDHRGEFNSYAGYLNDLKKAHRLPILISEFGVPASRGLTHEQVYGWTQGGLSEKEQGEIISILYENIIHEGMMGGLIFTWQDEWFKRTWNTMDYDNPDRRPYWSNAQTNEQHFGLLNFDRLKIKVDGNTDEWKSPSLYEKQEGQLKGLYVDHDERYLYLRLDYKNEKGKYPMFLLDIIPEQGNQFIKGKEYKFTNGVDFVVNLNEKESRILIDEYYDLFAYQYNYQLDMIRPRLEVPAMNSGNFSKINYALSNELYLPEQNKKMSFSYYETGKLKQGNGNPKSKDYDSLADYYISESGVELRIPWLLLQAKDPSQKEFINDLYVDGMDVSKFVDQIHIGVLYVDENEKIMDSFPSVKNGVLDEMQGYSWENWDKPKSKERLKQSYYSVKDLFENY